LIICINIYLLLAKIIKQVSYAHLYIDSKKQDILYRNFVHICNIIKGNHTLKFTLNANYYDECTHHNNPNKDK